MVLYIHLSAEEAKDGKGGCADGQQLSHRGLGVDSGEAVCQAREPPALIPLSTKR